MDTKIIVLLVVVTIPIILSLVSLFKVILPSSIKGYFYADKKVNSKQFIDTTVAYAFQIAAISLFATWGYIYGFWTLWVPFFWFLGYRILQWLNNNNYLDSFLQSDSGDTIHGFIASKYNWKYLSLLAGFATLIGLSGTAFFEAEFVSNSLVQAISQDDAFVTLNISSTSLVVFFLFVVIALLYIVIGGFKAIIWTDSIQLKTGFIAILSFVGITFGKTIANGNHWSGMILFILTISLMILLMLQYRKLNELNSEIFRKKTSSTFIIGLIVLIISLLTAFLIADKQPTQDSFSLFIQNQNFKNPLSLGLPAIISLLIANSLWQVVDISNWQRLSSYDTEKSSKELLSKSISFASYYSPLTWAIAIFLGMSFKYLNINIESGWTVLNELITYYFGSNIFFDNFYVLLLFFGMIMIMFSTLDSLISSISYTVYEDIVNIFRKKDLTLKGARIWTIIFTFFFFILYVYFRTYVAEIDKILYAFYSFQIALFPTIFLLLIGKPSSVYSAVTSIVSGMVASIIVLIYLDPYSYSALIVLVVSSIFYYVPNIFIKTKRNG